MIKRIALMILLIAVSTFLITNIKLTGKAVEGECSGTNNYYLCIDGSGDIVLGPSAVQQSEMNESVGGYDCKSVSLESNENFIFRYGSNVSRGLVYDSNQELLGSNSNSYNKANYKCYVEGDCSILCTKYRACPNDFAC